MTQAARVQQKFAQISAHKPDLRVVSVVDDVVELFYVHRAVPVVGSRIGVKGECDFELFGVPISPDMTPAQIREMKIAPRHVQKRKYRGFISEGKGDNGMVSGYVWMFKGGMPLDTTCHPVPKIAADWQPKGNVAAQIDMVKRIAAKRHPAPKARNPKCICGG